MSSKEEEFKIKEFCWVKMSGYPIWPAYIKEKMKSSQYKVQFIGDNHEGLISKKGIFKWTKENTNNYLNNTKQHYQNIFKGAIKFKELVDSGNLNIEDHWNCYCFCVQNGTFNKERVDYFAKEKLNNINNEKKINKKNNNKKLKNNKKKNNEKYNIFQSPVKIKSNKINNNEINNEKEENKFIGNKRERKKNIDKEEKEEINNDILNQLNKILEAQKKIKKETQDLIEVINDRYIYFKNEIQNQNINFKNKNKDIQKKIDFLNFLYLVFKIFQGPFSANNFLKEALNEIKVKSSQ